MIENFDLYRCSRCGDEFGESKPPPIPHICRACNRNRHQRADELGGVPVELVDYLETLESRVQKLESLAGRIVVAVELAEAKRHAEGEGKS